MKFGTTIVQCCHKSLTFVSPIYFNRIIFPVLKKLLFTPTTKADVRVCAVECVRALQASLRAEKVWLWADDTAQQEEIKRITSSV